MKDESMGIKRLSAKLAALQGENEKLKESESGYRQEVKTLKRSEEYFRAITQNSSDIIIIVDKTGTITYVNPSIERFMGYKPEELTAKSGFDFIMPTDLPRAIFDFGKAILTKKVIIPNAFRVRHKDGTERVLEGVGNNLLNDPAVRGFVMNVRDITERKKAEEELIRHREHLEDLVGERTSELKAMNKQLKREVTERRQAEQQRRAFEQRLRRAEKMEAIGTLAGGIAHDFNNILSAIVGYTEIALMETGDDDRLGHYLNRVLKASARAKDLVKQILAFSRQQEQERKPVLVVPIIEEAIKLLRSSLPSTIELTQNVTDESVMVLADPSQIYQVVMNLCTNAAHAMRETGGALDIQLVRETIEPSRMLRSLNLTAGDYAKLTVTDTGHGIDPSIMDRIFDPFFTTKGPGEGTGLGLSVVYGIARNLDGSIDISSEPGKGTIVTAYFPLIEPEELKREQVTEAIPGGSERILFVDDEAVLVEWGDIMLRSLGYLVTPRASSIEALEAFRANPHGFDLVITDMTMPNMRGDQLSTEILRIRSDIPIILCTGFSEMISEEKAAIIGIRQFIMKPIDKRKLADTIRKALRQP
ncbi:MAG: PAS domain S-box protein [Syntrophales bacterium]